MLRFDSRQASQRRSWKTALEVDGRQELVDYLNFVVKPACSDLEAEQ